MVEIYTDGSCRGNPGCGGYGVVVLIEDKEVKGGRRIDRMYYGRDENTTNNRMELSALLDALELTQKYYKHEKCIIKSDSAYCVNMFNSWITNWHHNNWTRNKNQYIENLDLVKRLWEYRKIEWPNFIVEKIPGHSNIFGNEVADLIATNKTTKLREFLKENGHEYALK